MKLDEIIIKDKKYFMNTSGDRMPVAFTHGKGCKLYDTEGKEYTDFLAGIAVNCLGYGDEGLAACIYKQAQNVLHTSNIYYIPVQTELAELLSQAAGGYKVFFGNSGAEANEGAIKLARKYFYTKGQPRYEVITALDSFHGRTLATVAATGQPKYQAPYAPLPAGFVNVPYNDIEAIKKAITPFTAAVMLETIQGESGVIEGNSAYLMQVRALCDEKGILLIFDEVQTGIGRTGTLFSFQQMGVTPDIFTLAKGLAGGVPIGAVLAKPSVAAFQPGDHGSTFGGNFLACAAGKYVIEKLLQSDILQNVTENGAYFKGKLSELKAKHTSITDVRGRGLMLGAALAGNIDGKQLVRKALEKGYIINCAGHNTLRFVPPLIITKEEIDGLIIILDEILTDMEEK